MTRPRPSKLWWLLGVLLVAGCAGAPDTDAELSSFINEVRRTHRDYSPTSGPRELAGLAELTVQGEIVQAQPGQLYAPLPGEPPMIATTVLEVEVVEVLAGDPALVQNGMVFIEIAHPAFVGTEPEAKPDQPVNEPAPLSPFDTSAFASQVPLLDGVFFLDDRTDEPYWETVLEVGAGRPDGSRLFATFTEGFLVESASGELTSVYVPLEELHDAWTHLRSIQDVINALD